ncbi:MAG: DUF2797 domain-containing protein [Bacteroidales bacterium]|nr:DUF2797 domain-containing protein [Bacteroidales bacterium]
MSPSLRRALYSRIYGNELSTALRSKLYEDIVAMYLRRNLEKGLLSFGADLDKKDGVSPDFVIETMHKPLVLEVGTGKTNTRQINKYQKEKRYGIIVNAQIETSEIKSNCLILPLQWFYCCNQLALIIMHTGNLQKMRTEHGQPVQYYLQLGKEELHVNNWIGKELYIDYQGVINCIKCGRVTNKSFSQGYCYPCFLSAPETEECVLRPELCRAHEGIARDMEFATAHCLIDHYVYFAVSSGLKVGVTRNTQVPTRWIDQGANCAMPIARTPNRHTAGLIEVALKQHYADKTNWRKMLSGQYPNIDLVQERDKVKALLHSELLLYHT